jgi:cell division inhibitor SepF
MTKLFNRVLNFVGWDSEEEQEQLEEQEKPTEEFKQHQFYQHTTKKQSGKVVSMHQQNQFKVVIIQPEAFEDAQGICEHLKDKKPVIINLEILEKETAQRIVDFLSGSVYALEGNIQKVSNGIFLIAPNNVDIMGDFKEDLKNKTGFPWMK